MIVRIVEEEPLFEMAKLMKDYAKDDIADFGDFIYFSQSNSSHGPRIKFSGGTKQTYKTSDAPTMSFTVDGVTELELQPWMTKKNCPNAFDKSYVDKVTNFVHTMLPVLLLTWFEKLDEGYTLKYFEGNLNLQALLNKCDVDYDIKRQLTSVNDLEELHIICKKLNLYKF